MKFIKVVVKLMEHLVIAKLLFDNSFLSKALLMGHAAQCSAHASASILLAGWIHRRHLFLVSNTRIEDIIHLCTEL